MKKFRNLFVTYFMAVCAVFLVACGGGQLDTEASIDKAGSYSDSSTSALSTAVGTDKTPTITSSSSGYKCTIQIESPSSNIKATYLCKGSTIEDMQLAMKMELTTTVLNTESKTEGNLYIKDGFAYLDAQSGASGNLKYKYNLAANESEIENFLSITDNSDISEILSTLTDITNTAESKIKVEKAESGQISKYKITMASGITSFTIQSLTVSEFEVYVIIDGTELVGYEINLKSSYTYASQTYNNNLKMTVAKLTGDISFPSLSDYTEYAE